VQGGFGSITTLIVLSFVAACGLFALHLPVAGAPVLIGSALGVVAIGSGFIPGLLTRRLQRGVGFNTKPVYGRSNAILLLGGSDVRPSGDRPAAPSWIAYSRIAAAAALYLEGKKAQVTVRIFVAQGSPAYANALASLGVNNEDVVVRDFGRNTYEHARNLAAATRDDYDVLFLVTSGLHMKRAILYFKHHGIAPTPVPSDYIEPEPSLLPLSYNFTVMDVAAHQVIGILRLPIYNRLGLNSVHR
jgi:uncharacterized SAM-binding protein YcdF (DUF218 family)